MLLHGKSTWIATVGALGALGIGLCSLMPCMRCPGESASAARTSAATMGAPSIADFDVQADLIDVRSASVFGGACHYNGELMTQGGEAFVCLSIRSGVVGGVDLAGVRAAALIAGEGNLKLGGSRESLVFVDPSASAAQADAAVALLTERAQGSLGRVLAVERSAIDCRQVTDGWRVTVGDFVEWSGAPMPDLACCKMPNLVWYEPLVAMNQRRVGLTDRWRAREPRLAIDLDLAHANSSFIGTLAMFDGACAAE